MKQRDSIGLVTSLAAEREAGGIIVQTQLGHALPFVLDHGGWLQQVALNPVRNAAEAEHSVSDRARVLKAKWASSGVDHGAMSKIQLPAVRPGGR
jgi:nitrogen-specific signal transduction histidine kinase